jgi:hypothetical protein
MKTVRKNLSRKRNNKSRKNRFNKIRGGINWKFWEKPAPAAVAAAAPAGQCPACPVCESTVHIPPASVQMPAPAPAPMPAAPQIPAQEETLPPQMGGRKSLKSKKGKKSKKSKSWFQIGCRRL